MWGSVWKIGSATASAACDLQSQKPERARPAGAGSLPGSDLGEGTSLLGRSGRFPFSGERLGRGSRLGPPPAGLAPPRNAKAVPPLPPRGQRRPREPENGRSGVRCLPTGKVSAEQAAIYLLNHTKAGEPLRADNAGHETCPRRREAPLCARAALLIVTLLKNRVYARLTPLYLRLPTGFKCSRNVSGWRGGEVLNAHAPGCLESRTTTSC